MTCVSGTAVCAGCARQTASCRSGRRERCSSEERRGGSGASSRVVPRGAAAAGQAKRTGVEQRGFRLFPEGPGGSVFEPFSLAADPLTAPPARLLGLPLSLDSGSPAAPAATPKKYFWMAAGEVFGVNLGMWLIERYILKEPWSLHLAGHLESQSEDRPRLRPPRRLSDQPDPAPLQRNHLLQLRAHEWLQLLGVDPLRGGRQPDVGVLRRDRGGIAERCPHHLARRRRDGRGLLPSFDHAAGQHGQRGQPVLARARRGRAQPPRASSTGTSAGR